MNKTINYEQHNQLWTTQLTKNNTINYEQHN